MQIGTTKHHEGRLSPAKVPQKEARHFRCHERPVALFRGAQSPPVARTLISSKFSLNCSIAAETRVGLPTSRFVVGVLKLGPLILLANSAWRPLHLAPPDTTEQDETRKSPATTWRPGAERKSQRPPSCRSRTPYHFDVRVQL